ncbi:MAG TPA: VTT domain-containing protein [Dongiaceae bacterium]|nr:VTT domain-containing protein [Dongiaceae bacterium]
MAKPDGLIGPSGFVYTDSFPVLRNPSSYIQIMHTLLSSLGRHGYTLTFAVLMAEAVGLPFPASIALVAAGAAIASHTLSATGVVIAAVIGLLAGDIWQFWLGRYTGWALLGFLCRLSMNPETCILRSAESFYKRGRQTLLVAKFVPGVNTMAAPLAGSMKMPFLEFLRLDLAGSLLYTGTYLLLGYISRDFLAAVLNSIYTASRVMEAIIIAALVVYVVYRIVQYQRYREYDFVPRIHAEELAERIAAGEGERLQIVDVRSHGYYDVGAERIFGSIRIEPNNLEEELKNLPKDKEIYLYCT